MALWELWLYLAFGLANDGIYRSDNGNVKEIFPQFIDKLGSVGVKYIVYFV